MCGWFSLVDNIMFNIYGTYFSSHIPVYSSYFVNVININDSCGP